MKTFRSQTYLAFVRSQPCLICGREATCHHEPLGMNFVGGKPPDSHAVPLCPECHAQRHSYGANWLDKIVDVRMTIIKLLTRYLETRR